MWASPPFPLPPVVIVTAAGRDDARAKNPAVIDRNWILQANARKRDMVFIVCITIMGDQYNSARAQGKLFFALY
jgi:hypothetical protein